MSLPPLPEPIAGALQGADINRSLLFDRGFPKKKDEKVKRDFLGRIAGLSAPPDFLKLMDRRKSLFDRLGDRARRMRLTTRHRLALGLGLPNPAENGFLFHRLTGSPYLPGSSIKGLLRAAAGWAAKGELEEVRAEDRGFWEESLDRVFGPHFDAPKPAARGRVIFHDSFPSVWPILDVEVLTPHQQGYNGWEPGANPVYPADWNDPIPVPFLTVPARTEFVFFFEHRGQGEPKPDLDPLARLLRVALDRFGIGAKTSSGYGSFWPGRPPRGPSTAQPKGNPVWSGMVLELRGQNLLAQKGKRTASCRIDQIEDADLLAALKKKKKKRKEIRAEIEVTQGLGNAKRIAWIRNWEEKPE